MWEDMPMPGTAEWGRWFNQQDPQTQQEVFFSFGLSNANEPIAGNDQGQMLPEITGQSYGMLNQLAPPPVINSKGKVQPQGTEQMQKETNLFQDRLSLGTDNMLAAIAGQYAPTAFTPTYEPQGNPVTATGLRQLQSLSQTGGWEGFMAMQMLPTEYGGGGMSASQAKGALKTALRAVPDPKDQEAVARHQELLDSLTPRYETTPLKPGETPPTKDYTTDQGLANAFDFTDIDTVSRGWQSDLAKDPVVGYTDPRTGLSYEGAKAKNTPTMDWFDKYGLPYADKRYDDPESIRGMQDAVAPWKEGQSQELEDQTYQDAIAANAKARAGLADANGQMDVIDRAYRQATNSGVLKPATQATTVTDTPWSTFGGPTVQGGAGRGPMLPPTTRTIPGESGRDTFFMDVDKHGRPTGMSLNQAIPNGVSAPEDAGAGLTGATNFNFAKQGATIGSPATGGLDQLMPFLKQIYSKRQSYGPDSQNAGRTKVAAAQIAAAGSVPLLQAASKSSDTSMQRQLARGKMLALANSGRTPLADTLAGRMMAARSAGIYG